MNSVQSTQVRLAVFVDPRQGCGTTAFEQYAEGNNGAQFDINIVDQRCGLVATVPAAGKSGFSKVLAHNHARRMVACWNACDGVETDLIEAAGDGLLAKSLKQVGEKHAELRSAEAQRDELMEVLDGVLKIERGTSGRIILEGWHEQVIAAAIAKVKGGAE